MMDLELFVSDHERVHHEFFGGSVAEIPMIE